MEVAIDNAVTYHFMCAHHFMYKHKQMSSGGNVVCDTVEFCGSLLLKTALSFRVPLVHKILGNFVLKYKNMGYCVIGI